MSSTLSPRIVASIVRGSYEILLSSLRTHVQKENNRTFIDTGCDARLIENFDIHRPEKKVGCRPELPPPH